MEVRYSVFVSLVYQTQKKDLDSTCNTNGAKTTFRRSVAKNYV